MNSWHTYGNVTEQPLSEIWGSARRRALAEALDAGNYELGCQPCGSLVAAGAASIAVARTFDGLPRVSGPPDWPTQIEFALTNTCNLQCVMCMGEWSSSIRAHREHLPPLPKVYGDAFFEELAAFVPHLHQAKFLGGEPFLGAESLRAMTLIADLKPGTPITVTTNATQWNRRVEHVLDRLPTSIVVSLDGAERGPFQSIRVGADFDAVVENLDRFRRYADERRTSVSLAYCLMTNNWEQFVPVLRFAEDRNLAVGVNLVSEPGRFSLDRLPADRLAGVVEALERSVEGVGPSLDRNRPVLEQHVSRLRHRLDSLRPGASTSSDASSVSVSVAVDPERHARKLLHEWIDQEPIELELDADESVVAIRPDPADVFGMDLRPYLGTAATALLSGPFVDELGSGYQVQLGVELPGRLRSYTLRWPTTGRELRVMIVDRDGDGSHPKALLALGPSTTATGGDGHPTGDVPRPAVPTHLPSTVQPHRSGLRALISRLSR